MTHIGHDYLATRDPVKQHVREGGKDDAPNASAGGFWPCMGVFLDQRGGGKDALLNTDGSSR